MESLDWKERILSLPLWEVVMVVAGAGLAVGSVLWLAVRRLQEGAFGQIELLAQFGAVVIPVMTVFTVLKWLFDTLIIWIAVQITGRLSGEPFQVSFLEGYRNMLPVTMLMVVNSSLALVLSAVTGLWLLMLVAWFVDLFILRLFLEMDWYEVFLLNAVLGFFSCVTGGLL